MQLLETLGHAVANATMTDWVLLALGLLALLYWLGTRRLDHFERAGIPYTRPLPFFGSMAAITLGRISFSEFALKLYREHEGKAVFGFFQFQRPTLYIRDIELIKAISVKEFDHFVDHQQFTSENANPLFGRNLFALNGQEWRDMRATLSPAFTSSKMRNIFKLIDLCGEQMINFLEEKVLLSPGGVYEAEMKDFFSRFANDVIATSAFGIECDSLKQPNNEFYLMGRDLTNMKGIRALVFLGYLLSPKLMTMLGIKLNSKKVEDFFHTTVHETIRERQQKGIFRPDMLQLLMQAREGKLKADAEDEHEVISGARTLELSDMDITAQAVIFFFAGFDTVSVVMSYIAFALTRHPDEQERVQQEVDEAFESNGGRLTYEAVQNLKYFDMFISEVLRLYAAAPNLDRKCTKDFTIPAQNGFPAYTVRKGDVVWLAVYGIQKDPQYWPNPDKFDPERFSDENKPKIKPFTYMPFGVGPRICIATRFALMEVKVALAHILRRFHFRPTEKTPKEVVYAPSDIGGGIKGGFWMGLVRREAAK